MRLLLKPAYRAALRFMALELSAVFSAKKPRFSNQQPRLRAEFSFLFF
jgi:hypothetical protein